MMPPPMITTRAWEGRALIGRNPCRGDDGDKCNNSPKCATRVLGALALWGAGDQDGEAFGLERAAQRARRGGVGDQPARGLEAGDRDRGGAAELGVVGDDR